METDRLLASTPSAETPARHRSASGEIARPHAPLLESDWERVYTLRRLGLTDTGFYRLLRLWTLSRRDPDPAADGLQHDPRAEFARWLVAHGRLTDGA